VIDQVKKLGSSNWVVEPVRGGDQMHADPVCRDQDRGASICDNAPL